METADDQAQTRPEALSSPTAEGTTGAAASASSKLPTLQMGAAGPKLSLPKMSMSGVQSVRMVGSTNQPLS